MYPQPSAILRQNLMQSHVPYSGSEKEQEIAKMYRLIVQSFLRSRDHAFEDAYMKLLQHPHLPLFNSNHLERIYLHWKRKPAIIQDLLFFADDLGEFIGSHKFWNFFFSHYDSLSKSVNMRFTLAMINYFVPPNKMEELPLYQLNAFYFLLQNSPLFRKPLNKNSKDLKTYIKNKYRYSKEWFWATVVESKEELLVLSQEQYVQYMDYILLLRRDNHPRLLQPEFWKWLREHYTLASIAHFQKPLEIFRTQTPYRLLYHIWDNNPKGMRDNKFFVPFKGFSNIMWDEIIKQALGDFHIPLVYFKVLGSLEGLPEEWFIHALQGKPLRTAPGLPILLSAKAEHFLNEASNLYSIMNSRQLLNIFFLAELLARGADKQVVYEIARTRISNHFLIEPTMNVRNLMSANSQQLIIKMMDAAIRIVQLKIPYYEIGELADYMSAYIFNSQHKISWKGVTASSLLRRSEEWHLQFNAANQSLNKDRSFNKITLPLLPIEPNEFEEKGVIMRFKQLIKWKEFLHESASMRHCVSTYFSNCMYGDTCIFSLQRLDGEVFHSQVTIEIRNGQIVQTKGKFNRSITAAEKKIINRWVEENAEFIYMNKAA